MTDKSAAAIRELAEHWMPMVRYKDKSRFIECLTALISEHYVAKAAYIALENTLAKAEAKNLELLQQRDELREALKELVHLHGCEQEGLLSGQPTPEQWYRAVEKAEAAINNTQI